VRHRVLGNTGIEVSELALGTWGLSGDGYGAVPEVEQERVIVRARALGITLFETADSYGRGAMERRLGRLLRGDTGATVVTKVGNDLESVPARKRFDRAYLLEAVARSAERLQHDPVEIVLLHNPSLSAVEHGEATGALAELVEQGRVLIWGVSAGSAEVARAALKQGARVVSLAHNVFCTKDLRDIAGELGPTGAGLLAHSVLAYGLLTGLWAQDRQFAPEDHRVERWTPDELRLRIRQLDALRPLVGGPVPSLRGLALRYVLATGEVSAAVIGPRSALQLDQLVREAGKGPPYLPDDATTALTNRLRAAGVDV
jgi:aryl-alcohol dehydrogenase-like predicted oxidoreductase